MQKNQYTTNPDTCSLAGFVGIVRAMFLSEPGHILDETCEEKKENTMTHTLTEADIKTALNRDIFYGQIPLRIIVPEGYQGSLLVDGIRVKVSKHATEPFIVPAEGGRLAFDGTELKGAHQHEH